MALLKLMACLINKWFLWLWVSLSGDLLKMNKLLYIWKARFWLSIFAAKDSKLKPNGALLSFINVVAPLCVGPWINRFLWSLLPCVRLNTLLYFLFFHQRRLPLRPKQRLGRSTANHWEKRRGNPEWFRVTISQRMDTLYRLLKQWNKA